MKRFGPISPGDQEKSVINPTLSMDQRRTEIPNLRQPTLALPAGVGGGDRPKSEDQPHAKQIAHAPQPTVWSPDKEREPVPVTGDAERPLQDARRTIAGRSEG